MEDVPHALSCRNGEVVLFQSAHGAYGLGHMVAAAIFNAMTDTDLNVTKTHSAPLPCHHFETVLPAKHINRFIRETFRCTAITSQMDKLVNDNPRDF